jgi:hypothetical protein
MSIDAYSLCPGGTGKKIKFCCNDILPELQKIDRMIEGEQYNACLQHLETLLAKEPGRDRECLLATKCLMQRVTGQVEAARNTAAAFLVKYPNNQVALAEMAIQSAENNVRAAFGLLQQAMHAADGNLTSRVYQAIGAVAGHLLQAGFALPARALLQLQCDMVPDDDRPAELLAGFCQAADIPLLLRDEPPLAPPADKAAWAGKFEHAMTFATVGDWQTAADRLTELTGEAANAPAVWLDLAILRGWLADNVGAIEALHQYAALRAAEPDGLEDASEAEAKAMFLSADPLGDQVDVLKIVWTIKDAERAQEALLSSAQWRTVPFDPAMFRDGENPPPKAAFMLLDRPMPSSPDGPGSPNSLTRETIPCMVGQALLYGRQTDREARLEVMGVAADDLDAAGRLVHAAAGEYVEPEPKKEVVSHWSASQQALLPTWQPPRGASPETLETMMAEYTRDTILNRWPDRKLGVLGDRSPREAAADPACRARLMAAVLVLQSWAENLPGVPDFNELRATLGLPTLGVIQLYAERAIWELPIARLARLSAEGLSDQSLAAAYHRAAAFAVHAAAQKFAKAVVERSTFADVETRMAAYATLVRTERDVAKALDYVSQARRAMDDLKVSHASWDLMELSLCFAARDMQNAMRLIEHIQRQHLEEPGVGEALTRLLISVGLLRPDGTPAYGPAAGGPTSPMPAAEPAAAGGLWTPDSGSPPGPAAGGKLWTPD